MLRGGNTSGLSPQPNFMPFSQKWKGEVRPSTGKPGLPVEGLTPPFVVPIVLFVGSCCVCVSRSIAFTLG